MKIKITEYFPGAMLRPDFVPDGGPVQQADPTQSNNFFAPGQPGGPIQQQNQFGGVSFVNTSLGANHPGATGQRYYTIQRVNGNGGNGKGDGVPGPHKHALEESDRVKKNSIQRLTMKKDKEEKKTQVCTPSVFEHARATVPRILGNSRAAWETLSRTARGPDRCCESPRSSSLDMIS